MIDLPEGATLNAQVAAALGAKWLVWPWCAVDAPAPARVLAFQGAPFRSQDERPLRLTEVATGREPLLGDDQPLHSYMAGVGKGNWYIGPRYDTDWAVTGPLIHRFKLRLLPMEPQEGGCAKPGDDWRWQVTPYKAGTVSDIDGFGRFGVSDHLGPLMPHAIRNGHNAIIYLDAPSELVGVCHLIIAMGRAGWLERDPREGGGGTND